MARSRTHFEQIPVEQIEKVAVSRTVENEGQDEGEAFDEEPAKKIEPHRGRSVAQNVKQSRR